MSLMFATREGGKKRKREERRNASPLSPREKSNGGEKKRGRSGLGRDPLAVPKGGEEIDHL